ncbi:hypothetical protein AURANDRAFT_69065, partial [Aureococcus anophagefferens]
RRVFERYSLEEIEQKFLPYDHSTAGEFIYEVNPSEGTDISPEGCLIPPNTKGISTSSAWREQVDHLLLDKIMNNRKLMAKLGGMSLPEDGGAANDGAPEGVSFLMGISHMTGVPFSIMHDPTIADLWMVLRDMFLTINQGRVKGNKLTNIKISIASRDGKTRSSAKDLGTAVMTSGGPNVDSHVLVSEPERRIDTWGRLCEINRRTGITHELGAGVRWTITFYSDFRNRFSQNTAVQLMDSVTDGTLWSADQHPQKDTEAEGAAANSTETTAEAEVWPPWKNADRDERGLPLPDQPKDLGVDDQWRVKPATDQELIDTMKRIGVTDNPVLGDSMKQHFKEMIAYCWGMFDKTLRPVDSDPVGIQFLDPRQQPIKLQPYRLNAPKLAFLKDTIQEWIRDGRSSVEGGGCLIVGYCILVLWGSPGIIGVLLRFLDLSSITSLPALAQRFAADHSRVLFMLARATPTLERRLMEVLSDNGYDA